MRPARREEGMNGKELVRLWYERMWNRWDESVFAEILDPAIELRGSLGQAHRGYRGVAAYMQFVREAFPDFHNEIELLLEEDSRVFAKLRYTGTHQGALFGIEPTGRRITYAGAALFRIRELKIFEVWVLGDLHGLLQQLKREGER